MERTCFSKYILRSTAHATRNTQHGQTDKQTQPTNSHAADKPLQQRNNATSQQEQQPSTRNTRTMQQCRQEEGRTGGRTKQQRGTDGGEVVDQDPDWVREMRKAVQESRESSARKIIFAVFVSWKRDVGVERTRVEEYSMVRSRVEERWPGSALFVGCSPRLVGGVGYDAVILFRGVLAVYGEVKALFEQWLPGGQVRLLESTKTGWAERLAEYLGDMQDDCARGNETYGRRIVEERGDAETMEMLEGLSEEQRYDGKNDIWMEEMSGRMRWYRMSSWEQVVSAMGG